jgi:hypothetical protein
MSVELFFKGQEELARVRGDRMTNHQTVEVLPAVSVDDPAAADGAADAFVRRQWSEVRVGDVVKVYSRETFPADLLLLRASDPPGQCWVNTKPLDGETDSKLRVVPKALLAHLDEPGACEPKMLRTKLVGGHLRCEEPNDKVNDIIAQLILDGIEPTVVSEDNFLLRGCQLRNTDWVLALVVATGVQTKINYTPGAEHIGKPMLWTERVKRTVVDILLSRGPKPKASVTHAQQRAREQHTPPPTPRARRHPHPSPPPSNTQRRAPCAAGGAHVQAGQPGHHGRRDLARRHVRARRVLVRLMGV